MKFPNNFELKPANILKIVGLGLVFIIIIVVGFRLVGSTFSSFAPEYSLKGVTSQGMMALSTKADVSEDYARDSVGLSYQNVVTSNSEMVPADGGLVMGDDAEDFEVSEYYANIETRNLEKTCQEVAALKSREDVIFESANEYEKSCSYTFKVKHGSVEEILAVIKDLDPKELNESTYTIKKLVDDYTSELEILEKKMASIDDTLNNAVKSYDNITSLATRVQDVETLAKIIDSKIGVIERLTQERININAQLERLTRSKAEQLDRLEYTYFNVYVLENKYINGQDLKDSWKAELKSFVRDVNSIVQDITINLVTLLLLILQYIIYLFIILVVAKYGWKFTKYIWKK